MTTSGSSNKVSWVAGGVTRTYRVTRAAADLAVSANSARGQQGVGAVRGGADVALKYRTLKAEAGFKTLPIEEKLFAVAGDTLTVTGLALSAVALPTMAKKTATSFQELKTLIHDPTATAEARLNKVEELARASGGTIFAAQGVKLGAQGTIGILSRNQGIARVVARVGAADTAFMRFVGSPLGKAFNALLPIADVAVLVGEVIATRRTFNDPTATASTRLRKVLDLSLAAVKTAFWIFPAARALKAAYSIASFAQLALTIKDFWPQVQPNLVKVGQAIGWGVTHPIEAVGAIVTGTAKGIGWVAQKAVGAFAWTADKVLHPVTTWNNAYTEVSAWVRAYTQAKAQQVSQWFTPGQATQVAAAQPLPAPAAAMAPTLLAPGAAVPAPAPAPVLVAAAAPAPAPIAPVAPAAPAPAAPAPAAPAAVAPVAPAPAPVAPAPVMVAAAPAVAPAVAPAASPAASPVADPAAALAQIAQAAQTAANA